MNESRPQRPQDRSDNQPYGVRSVEVSLRVLEALASAHGPLPLRDISRRSGLSGSQAYRYLRSFIHGGLVAQDPATGYYDFGEMALRVGLAALERTDAIKTVGEAVRELVARIDHSGGIAVWGNHGPTLVRYYRSRAVLMAPIELGTVFPVLSSALGLICLTYLPDWMTENLVVSEMQRKEKGARGVNKQGLQKLKDKTRADGYSELTSSFVHDGRAIAAPVFNSQRELAAVIALVGMPPPRSEDDDVLRELITTASATSAKLGFKPD